MATYIENLEPQVYAHTSGVNKIGINWSTPVGANGLEVYYWLSYVASKDGVSWYARPSANLIGEKDINYQSYIGFNATLDTTTDYNNGYNFYKFTVVCTTKGYVDATGNYEYGENSVVHELYSSNIEFKPFIYYPSTLYLDWTDVNDQGASFYSISYQTSDDGITWANGDIPLVLGDITESSDNNYHVEGTIGTNRNHNYYRFFLTSYNGDCQLSAPIFIPPYKEEGLMEGLATIEFVNKNDFTKIKFNWVRESNGISYNKYYLGYLISNTEIVEAFREPTWITINPASMNNELNLIVETEISQEDIVDDYYIAFYFNPMYEGENSYWSFDTLTNNLQFKVTSSSIKVKLDGQWVDCNSFVKYNDTFVPFNVVQK